MHPRLQQWLPRMISSASEDPSQLTAAVLRTEMDVVTPGPRLDLPEVREVELGGVAPGRLYVPPSADRGALVLYFHGGGFVCGNLDTHDALCRQLAFSAGVPLVSVEYPLAPEHPFPAASDVSERVLHWAAETGAEALGLSAQRLAVAGDSAGGALAAVAAQYARSHELELRAQALLYPVIDCDFERPSYREYERGLPVTREFMRWFWRQYLGGVQRTDDPRAAPMRASDLRGLAPALVLTAEYDPLHDEALAYAERLRAAGVDVETRHLEDMIHGFLNLTAIFAPAREQLEWAGRWLAERLQA